MNPLGIYLSCLSSLVDTFDVLFPEPACPEFTDALALASADAFDEPFRGFTFAARICRRVSIRIRRCARIISGPRPHSIFLYCQTFHLLPAICHPPSHRSNSPVLYLCRTRRFAEAPASASAAESAIFSFTFALRYRRGICLGTRQ